VKCLLLHTYQCGCISYVIKLVNHALYATNVLPYTWKFSRYVVFTVGKATVKFYFVKIYVHCSRVFWIDNSITHP